LNSIDEEYLISNGVEPQFIVAMKNVITDMFFAKVYPYIGITKKEKDKSLNSLASKGWINKHDDYITLHIPRKLYGEPDPEEIKDKNKGALDQNTRKYFSQKESSENRKKMIDIRVYICNNNYRCKKTGKGGN